MFLFGFPIFQFLLLTATFANHDNSAEESMVDNLLPNIPFFTDTNRISDGLSSTSPYDVLSPAFREYSGPRVGQDILQQRKEHEQIVAQSRREQGIAMKNAGGAEREKAVYELYYDHDGPSIYYPNTTFPVMADVTWNPSGFAIQAEEVYNVQVKGPQYWVDGSIRVDADGYPAHYDAISACYVAAGRCRSYLKNRKRLVEAHWFQLSCGVGNYYTKLQEAGENQDRYMPLREDELVHTLFPVGRNATFIAKHTGELICFANDGFGLYWNNQGRINVTVTRLSWPPPPPGQNVSSFSYEAYL